MFKAAAILYLVCIFLYILFSRTPDYFEANTTKGEVVKAAFDTAANAPALSIRYLISGDTFTLHSDMWLLKKYAIGENVRVIYNPTVPTEASLYAFIGYWLHWDELFITLALFIIFLFAAIIITGKNEEDDPEEVVLKKPKYDL